MKTEVRKQMTEDRGQKTEMRFTLHAARLWLIAGSLWLAAWSAQPAFAGNLDSPGDPATEGRMYTLEQIYDKVNDGTTPTKQSGGFNEPGFGPASTMNTLDDIEGKIIHGITDAAAGDVLTGKTFISRTGGSGETMVIGTLSSGSLPKTGQITNWATGDDETYGDPAGGYDVGLAQDEGTWTNYWTDGHRFTVSTVSGGDIVTDNVTGLIWAADGTAAGCNNRVSRTWTQAITWAEGLTFAGYSDWRLPNIYELFSISLLEAGAIGAASPDPSFVKANGAPYINQAVFTNTVSGGYWSSTTHPDNTTYALYVYFARGRVYYFSKTSVRQVRAVRGGQ